MRPIKGGKEDREYAATLRKRAKRGKSPLSSDEQEWLGAWDARVASMPKGRPPKDQQSAPEMAADGADGQPRQSPSDHPSGNPSAPADTPPPPPNVEPPPRVADAPTPPPGAAAGGASKDWRQKWRDQIHFSGDGRQMLCEGIGNSIVEGLAALREETAKVTTPRTPDPRALAGMFVLALDELLPERAKMTPKIGASVVTIGTIAERYYHAEAIKEFLKTDPTHQEWLRKQAERERTEQEQRAAHEAEVKANTPPVQYAEPPRNTEPPVNGTAIMLRPEPREQEKPRTLDNPDAIY